MPLSGLNAISVRPRGGVAEVELVPASMYAGNAPAAAAWLFREDRAHYSEELAGGMELSPLVRHILVVELPAGEGIRSAVERLIALSAGEGVVARVTMASGERIAAGYSSRFGTRYPLRVVKADSVSGRTPADFPSVTLTLESVDADISSALV